MERRVSLAQAASAAARVLREARIETPELDARVLLCHAAGVSHETYVAKADLPLAPEAASRLASYVERRLRGEPVSRILGVREFYGRDFRIDPHTLDPRPDTETLIEAALAVVDKSGGRGAPFRILDLGTGSGAILVTLLAELPDATGVGTDIDPAALRVAEANARDLGVAERARFTAADWLEGIAGPFDLVISNPPYIASSAIAGLPDDVRCYDPARALDGGCDGLSAYRTIVASAPKVLARGGALAVEIGADQAEAVSSLFREAGFDIGSDGLWRDLAGRPRVVAGTRVFGN